MTTLRKSGLGRNLNALLGDALTIVAKAEQQTDGKLVLKNMPIEKLKSGVYQPRSWMDEGKLQELADSIKEHGIIQPVTVRKLGYDKYQLISGERRFRASQLAGLTEIPAYIRLADDQAMLEMALVENIQRENLDPVEIAISYKRLIDECSLTQESLSQKVSKQRSTITNYLRLLKLPAEIQVGLRETSISMGHARALINVENKEAQLAIFKTIVEQDLSVRDTEELVRETAKEDFINSGKTTVTVKKSLMKTDKNISKKLQQVFNKSAEVRLAPNGKGRIILPFNSHEELNKFLAIMES
jgi:ParB family chromosome partitioning protein